MAIQTSMKYAGERQPLKRDIRDGVWLVVGTVHIGAILMKDGTTALLMHNDGMDTRSPGLSPDQADQLSKVLAEAAAEGRKVQSAKRN